MRGARARTRRTARRSPEHSAGTTGRRQMQRVGGRLEAVEGQGVQNAGHYRPPTSRDVGFSLRGSENPTGAEQGFRRRCGRGASRRPRPTVPGVRPVGPRARARSPRPARAPRRRRRRVWSMSVATRRRPLATRFDLRKPPMRGIASSAAARWSAGMTRGRSRGRRMSWSWMSLSTKNSRGRHDLGEAGLAGDRAQPVEGLEELLGGVLVAVAVREHARRLRDVEAERHDA